MKKLKWQKPILIDLGNIMTNGSTACHTGSSAETTCNNGLFPANNCNDGGVASR